MHSVLKHLLPVLAFVAVGYAQVFGLQRGFLCECGSSPKVILQDRCDSDHHGDDCHENESDDRPKDNGLGGTNPLEHASYKDDVTASRVLGGKVAVPQPQLYALISFESLPSALFSAPVNIAGGNRAEHFEDARDQWHHMLAHAIVLRV